MADEQIIIEFIADTSQIEGVIPTLQKIGALSKADVDALSKMSSKTSATSREAVAAGTQTAKTLKDVEKGAKNLANTFEKTFKAGMADALAEAGVSLEDFEKALKQSGLSMEGVQQGAAKLATETDGLKKELRKTTEAMAALAKIGERNSEGYEQLAAKAGELKKAIADANKDVKQFGSDTRGLDKVLMGARGIAGGFAVAQGAAALLGDENEELQKALLKVNAAMSVLMGLKELQELANTREFASLTALVGAKKLDVLQTNLQSAAESKNIVVRYAAIVAQKALNAAMAISPLGLIALAVAAIAAAWAVFATNARAAAEAQNVLNSALDSAGNKLETDLRAIDAFSEKYKAVLRSQGASLDELTKVEAENANRRIKRINDEITATANALNATKATDKESLKLKKDLADKKLELEIRLQDELRELEIKALDFQRKQYEDSLKSATAFADARVLQQKEGSRKELVAQIAAIRAREQEELKSAARLPGEVAKIMAQAARDIAVIRNQIKLFDLNEELAGINARLALAKKGSAEEFQLQMDSIKKQHEVELADKTLTDNQRLQLENEYIRKVEDLQKEHNRKTQEEAISTKTSEINARLAELDRANISENNAETLQLKKDLIDQQTALEVVAAQDSITNAEQLAARLKEIWAKSAADKEAIDTEAKKREIQYDLEITNLVLENEKKKARVEMGQGGLQQRINARKQYQRLLIQQIDEEESAYDRMWEDGLISYEDWNKKMLEIQGKRIEAELAAEQEKENRKRELISAGFDVLQQGMDAVFEIGAANRQAELDDTLAKLQQQYDAEVNNKTLSDEQKATLEDRYQKRMAQIKKAAYLKDRQARISQAIMNGLMAVTNALATVKPFYAALIAAGLAAATTGIQVAKIKSEPIPQFRKGTRSAPGGYAWVGEEGPELVRLNGGEQIWTYKQSEKIYEAWRGGSMASANQIIAGRVPRVDHELMSAYSVNKYGATEFDYDKMGKSVASHMPKQSVLQNNMDENGFTTFILENGNRTQIRNKRYRFD